MGFIPEPMLARRRELSERFLVGQGIEIGALHYPLWTSPRAHVRYVDRLDVNGLRHHYPELAPFDLVNVDVVDDGETLSSFEDGRLDFIIANHMLEHTENPLGTIRHHLKKVRNGGFLYYAVPNKRHSFDRDRELTTFEHLVRDDRRGAAGSRLEHLEEWARLVEKITDADLVRAKVQELDRTKYSIHYHVWDFETFAAFLEQARPYLGRRFMVDHLEWNGAEIIAVLRKAPPWRTLMRDAKRRAVELRRVLRPLQSVTPAASA